MVITRFQLEFKISQTFQQLTNDQCLYNMFCYKVQIYLQAENFKYLFKTVSSNLVASNAQALNWDKHEISN